MTDRHAFLKAVRRRLEAYHIDESIYAPRRAVASHTGTYHRRVDFLPSKLIRKIELDQAIETLPPEHKAAIKLRYVAEGIRVSDILPIMYCSEREFYRTLSEGVELVADALDLGVFHAQTDPVDVPSVKMVKESKMGEVSR